MERPAKITQSRLTGGALRQEAERYHRDNPGIRARDLATALGVSEAELVASRGGDGVTRLDGDWGDMLRALNALGEVMALTRNEHCVHEKHGLYDEVSIGPGHGLVLNHDIDLRLFLSHWHFGFAVSEEVKSGLRHSLQFFDIGGTGCTRSMSRQNPARTPMTRWSIASMGPISRRN